MSISKYVKYHFGNYLVFIKMIYSQENSFLIHDIQSIVLKAWFLAWSFLRSRRKVWFGAQAKLIHLTSQWRHNDVKFFNYDVIPCNFCMRSESKSFPGLRNLRTKIHAFSSICKILLSDANKQISFHRWQFQGQWGKVKFLS